MESGRQQRGMTLLEVMVALTIFALLGVMSYRGLTALISARDQVTSATQRWLQLQRLQQLLESDLAQAIPRGATAPDGRRLPAMAAEQTEEASLLRLVRGDGQTGPVAVEYRWRAGVLNVVESLPDRQAATPEHAEQFQIPVRTLAWEFLPPNGDWLGSWPPAAESTADALPRAVRLRLRLDGLAGDIVRVYALR